MNNIVRYPIFIILSLVATLALTIVSELVGFSHMNFVPLASPSYASWVYPVYFFVSFIVFAKIFHLPKKSMYYIVAISVIFVILLYFIFEGEMFANPTPFGIGAV